MSKQDFIFTKATRMNELTYLSYLQRLKKIATSIFEWTNLPKSCNARWLELSLFNYGSASFLYDNKYGFINTQGIPSGQLNIYGLPISINCFSFNYSAFRSLYTGMKNYEKDNPMEDDECILIMNDIEMEPTINAIQLFAYRLANMERTIDINLNAQKTPLMIVADEKQRLTMKNLYADYDGNQPYIFGDKKLLQDGNSITALKTDAPFISDKVQAMKKEIWNEILTYLGVNNIMEDKKERLIADEANSNNELINLNLQSFLTPRLEACKQINEKFGLNVGVRVRSDLKNIIKNVMSSTNDFSNIDDESEVDDDE